MAFLDKAGLEQLWQHIVSKLSQKVDKEDGKGLSTNDYTTEEKEQLGTLNRLVGDTAVATQISDAMSTITPDSIGALDQDDYYGIVRKEGSVVSAESLERTAIGVVTDITTTQDGSGDPAPDNIRQITGYNTATMTRTGRNLISHLDYIMTNGHNATTVSEDMINVTSPTAYDYGRIENCCLNGGTTYTLVIDWEVYGRDESSTETTSASYRVVAMTTKASQVATTSNGTTRIVKTYTPSEDIVTNIVWNPNYGSKVAAKSRTRIMLLEGEYTADTAPAFEPCDKQTLTAALPETVYGGTLDWTTGLLTVTHFAQTFDGSEAWADGGNGMTYTLANAIPSKVKTDNQAAFHLCSHYKPVKYAAPADQADMSCYTLNATKLCIKDTSVGTLDGLKAYLAAQSAAGTPVVIVHQLKPAYYSTIQLTPQQLAAIDGMNYVWSNCGDTCATFNYTPFLDAVNNKVDKVDGKDLSTNDYTTAEKDKLAGIEDGATNTVIDTELSSTSTNPVQNQAVSAAIDNLHTLVGDSSVSSQISSAISNITREDLLIVVSATEPTAPTTGMLWFDIS